MAFDDELIFEKELISVLSQYGWDKDVIRNPTEEELLKNWANILYNNNLEINRLNNQPLTNSEMQQILDQINTLRTPQKLNGFINGKTVTIKRDNPNDTLHYGKEISLKIYDRMEIAAGSSKYQIACQPIFKTPGIFNDRRGDILLLINGMPVIHIELKKTGIPVSQAINQFEKYSREGVFRGLYSLVQIFVAMNPEQTLYFANPGENNAFNPNYYFQWADYNNEPINEWKEIVEKLLSIPMAHMLIGFYTVADNTDGLLKVLKSYQYYAANAISSKVSKRDWTSKENRGGYIWHTTGSGKTMTSFKSAQLIASSKNADKVIFLVDRIELGTQSLMEYRNFASKVEDVQATENTSVLISKLKSTDPKDTLIVTSIQKMGRISDQERGLKSRDIELIKTKRIVVIVDEAHRSTFGTYRIDENKDGLLEKYGMLEKIKHFLTHAVFFGFTGTPILDKNSHSGITQSDLFGDELHRYSISDAIRDRSVLGFDPYKVSTYKDIELRKAIGLHMAKAASEKEIFEDEKKTKIYGKYLSEIKMVSYVDGTGNKVLGIEDYLNISQYDNPEHHTKVVEDVLSNWVTLSCNSKFHAILATSSIKEAIDYYRLFKEKKQDLKLACLFDTNYDNRGRFFDKKSAIVEILSDYNARYGMSFTIGEWGSLKKNIASRLAHKGAYIAIEKTPEKQIDLLIVVNQMLTGFDSKWINTIYLDKVLRNEHIIQAFSRTNRLYGPEKPFGTVKYYRKPHTMETYIKEAIKLYSGDKPLALFVPKIKENLEQMNIIYTNTIHLFEDEEKKVDLSKLPDDPAQKGEFSKLFRQLFGLLNSAIIQGFKWEDVEFGKYRISTETVIEISFSQDDYLILALRYKELSMGKERSDGDVPYEILGYLSQVDTTKIDTDYLNSNFEKFKKVLDNNNKDEIDRVLRELHSTFTVLTIEEQGFAYTFLQDIQSGDADIQEGKTLRDYITQYQVNSKNNQISKCAIVFGLDEAKLRKMMSMNVNSNTINEFGRFNDLIDSVDNAKARHFFESIHKRHLPMSDIHEYTDEFLRKFILDNGFDI